MSQLKNLLYSYVYNPTNENRLDLADEYYRLEQYAAALSYYYRDKDLNENERVLSKTAIHQNSCWYCWCCFCFC